MDEAGARVIVGAVTTLAGTVVFQPLDYIKTRLQFKHAFPSQCAMATLIPPSHACGAASHIAIPAFALASLGSAAMLRDAVARNGVGVLWTGTLASVYRSVPGGALYFVTLRGIQDALTRTGMPSGSVNLFSGFLGRSMVGILLNPLTLIKSRFESGLYSSYRSPAHAFVTIARTEGLRGLMVGVWPSVWRDAPYAGIYVASREAFKPIINVFSDSRTVISMASGVFAGVCASVATQPFDVVKTRAQLFPRDYPSVRVALVKIVREQGPRGLLAGIAPRLARKSLMQAMVWTLFEELEARAIKAIAAAKASP